MDAAIRVSCTLLRECWENCLNRDCPHITILKNDPRMRLLGAGGQIMGDKPVRLLRYSISYSRLVISIVNRSEDTPSRSSNS